ncbi:DMT family transporter [Thalassospira marina]|uniref:EamA family transporter n=1 Tax=Thalassospira marina TaxID=2048283 RepID=A0ABM6QD42_9PROT|nr:DMT family transporter [Thalassospira marina]AUG54197.1 EamA family transporter [Thalassospira marina]
MSQVNSAAAGKAGGVPMIAYILLIACALMWGSNHVVARGVNATVPLAALSFWRWMVALLLLTPVCLRYLRRDWPLIRQGWKPIFLIGTTGTFLFTIAIYLAAYNTTAVNTGLLNATTPIWVLLFASLLTADKPRMTQWVGVLVAGLGTAVIIAKGDINVFLEMDFVSGDLFALISAMIWAAYSMLLKYAPRGIHPFSLIFGSIVVGLVYLFPIYLWSILVNGDPYFTRLDPAWPDMLKIAYIGAGPAFLGYLFWNRGVGMVGAANAGVFLYLMPAFASVLAIIFLGEELHLYHLGGIALIAVGIWRATRREAAPAAAPAK